MVPQHLTKRIFYKAEKCPLSALRSPSLLPNCQRFNARPCWPTAGRSLADRWPEDGISTPLLKMTGCHSLAFSHPQEILPNKKGRLSDDLFIIIH